MHPRVQFEALQAARQRETTAAFGETYALRAGFEGILACGVRCGHPRRTRYIGRQKVHPGHILTTTGLNSLRPGAWFLGVPRRRSPRSPLTRLLIAPIAA